MAAKKTKKKAQTRRKPEKKVDRIFFSTGPIILDVRAARSAYGWSDHRVDDAVLAICRIVDGKPTQAHGTDHLVPGLLLDAPRAADADADKSAPTVSRNWYEKNVLGADWCDQSTLSAFEDKDYGRLLTFLIQGEDSSRVCWVRE